MKCISFERLSAFVDGTASKSEVEDIEKHREFCPSCREIIKTLKMEDDFLKEAIASPRLPEDFNEEVLSQLKPYKKKRKSWKYQLLTVASIMVAFGLGASLQPGLSDLFAENAGVNSISNVEPPLYSVKDQGMLLEITEVSASPLKIEVNYKIKPDQESMDKYQENLKKSRINPVLMSEDYSLPEVTVTDEEGEEIAYKSFSFPNPNEWNGSFVFYPLNSKEVPNSLNLVVEINEIFNKKGNWDIEVHVDLADAKKNTRFIPLDKELEQNGYKLVFREWSEAPNAKFLNYEVSISENENKELNHLLEGEGSNKYSYTSIEPILSVKTEAEEVLVNNGATLTSILGERFIMEQEFSNMVRGSKNYRALEAGEPLMVEVDGLTVNEPIDASFSFPIKEGENISVYNADNNWEIESYSTKKVPSAAHKEKINVKVKGSTTQGNIKSFQWMQTNKAVESTSQSANVSFTSYINEDGSFELEYNVPAKYKEDEKVQLVFYMLEKQVDFDSKVKFQVP